MEQGQLENPTIRLHLKGQTSLPVKKQQIHESYGKWVDPKWKIRYNFKFFLMKPSLICFKETYI